ncbi:MAG: hypothetical protein AAF600_15450 [Bacteroidota bacterium]
MNAISDLESVPEGLQNFLNSPNGRTLGNNIEDMKEVKFLDDQNNEMSIIGIQLKNPNENMNLTLYYDESINGMSYLIEEIELENGNFQINYLSPDGNYLFMQLEGEKEMMEITFMIDENNTPISLNDSDGGRVQGCGWSQWSSNFVGCIGRLASDNTFRVVAVAGAIGGYGAFIAVGAVVGCGVGEAIPCVWNWNTSYNNCTDIVLCSRSIPKDRLTNSGSITFNLVTHLPY